MHYKTHNKQVNQPFVKKYSKNVLIQRDGLHRLAKSGRATDQLDFASGQKIWDWVGGYQPVLLHLILIHEYLTFSQLINKIIIMTNISFNYFSIKMYQGRVSQLEM